MTSQSRTYQGESAETRISARKRLLLDTGYALMASDGWRHVTIDNLCREAKLNKRYFYESFADLNALAAAVVDELSAQLMEASLTAARDAQQAGHASHELARATLAATIRFLTDDSRRARVLFAEVADNPRALSYRKNTIRNIARAISAYGHEYHQATKPVPVAEMASAVLLGGSIEVIMEWLDGSLKMTFDELVEELAALWVLVGDGTVARVQAGQQAKKSGAGKTRKR